jgi:hypothetical protein
MKTLKYQELLSTAMAQSASLDAAVQGLEKRARSEAVATIDPGSPLTDEQAAPPKALEIDHHDPLLEPPLDPATDRCANKTRWSATRPARTRSRNSGPFGLWDRILTDGGARTVRPGASKNHFPA